MVKEKDVETLARWMFIHDTDEGMGIANNTILWDTGKFDLMDFGGDDFCFKCGEREKNIYRTRARKALEAIEEGAR